MEFSTQTKRMRFLSLMHEYALLSAFVLDVLNFRGSRANVLLLNLPLRINQESGWKAEHLASAASNPDGTGTSSRCGRQTNSAYAPLIGSAATIWRGSIPEIPAPSRSITPIRSHPGVKGSRGVSG